MLAVEERLTERSVKDVFAMEVFEEQNMLQ